MTVHVANTALTELRAATASPDRACILALVSCHDFSRHRRVRGLCWSPRAACGVGAFWSGAYESAKLV